MSDEPIPRYEWKPPEKKPAEAIILKDAFALRNGLIKEMNERGVEKIDIQVVNIPDGRPDLYAVRATFTAERKGKGVEVTRGDVVGNLYPPEAFTLWWKKAFVDPVLAPDYYQFRIAPERKVIPVAEPMRSVAVAEAPQAEATPDTAHADAVGEGFVGDDESRDEPEVADDSATEGGDAHTEQARYERDGKRDLAIYDDVRSLTDWRAGGILALFKDYIQKTNQREEKLYLHVVADGVPVEQPFTLTYKLNASRVMIEGLNSDTPRGIFAPDEQRELRSYFDQFENAYFVVSTREALT